VNVGILGGGQLARMLALAGHPLDIHCLVLDPSSDACAGAVSEHLIGAYDDPELLEELARRSDVVTYEFENVSSDSVRRLASRVPVFPSAQALATSADRLLEKSLFVDLGIPTPMFRAVESLVDLESAVADMSLPAVLKTRREGYDGKGQVVIHATADMSGALASLPAGPKILEEFVRFDREVSAIAVRGRDGSVAFYPVTENLHRGGILRLSIPRPSDPATAAACDYARRLLDALDYVGVLALELFVVGDRVLANEFAPRVHNSGHWTIDAAETSQFENHLRAILGLPLGGTRAMCHAAMLNFIGVAPEPAEALCHPDARLHLYGKAPRVGRKVGHVTVRADTMAELERRVAALSRLPGVDVTH
jgi:5-(carboxyamino)imidazole ribonucleotide synthase